MTSVDLSPLAWDGDKLLLIDSGDGQAAVHVPARRTLCRAHGLALFDTVQPGARVQVSGARSAPATITECAQPEHFLRRAV
ncbi:MAG: hypothetical protein M3Q40_09990 [Pseudomonadota bacterium]|nr:hypothetical protein [Pseudomonadota bacterium]